MSSWDRSQANKDQANVIHGQSDRIDSKSATGDDASGLAERSARGSRQRLVFSDKQIADDVLTTLPKLHAAVRNNATGDRWKHRNVKGAVRLAETRTNYPAVGPEVDLDIVHAIAAKTELQCHLNEALSVLLHQDSEAYDSTMTSLCGKRFKRGEVLFEQQMTLGTELERKVCDLLDTEDDNTPRQGLITVTSATMSPSTSLHHRLQSRHSRRQELLLSTCTHQYPDKKRAVHLMKTLPKSIQDQVDPAVQCTALRGEIDHIGVGFDLQFTPSAGGSNRHRTCIFMHTYASDQPSSNFSKDSSSSSEAETASQAADLAHRRATMMSPEAHSIMRTFAKSLSHFEHIIRRRRFGFQSFVCFPNEYAGTLLEKRCLICNKNFHFFRRDFYCQLCGHMACGDCSKVYEVEARIGEIGKSRCCRQCVARVHSCKFDDEDLLAALGPIIVDTPADAWVPAENSILSSSSGDEESTLLESEDSDLMGQLCSEDPEVRSHALEKLDNLVAASASPSSSSSSSSNTTTITKSEVKSKPKRKKSQVQRILASLEGYINQELSKARTRSKAETCVVSDRTRDYKYQFDSTKVSHEDIPLAPMPESQKDARRVEFTKNSGAIQPEYDRSALNLIAQVAAKRLGCPIGIVSMIDNQHFHAVGSYNLPAGAEQAPRNEVLCMHAVYAEKPLVVKNPQRDMRFSKMPCVNNDHGVKFYAGFPLRAPNGEVVGNLCALDGVAHNNISTKDYSTMETLAKLASDLLVPTTGRST